MIPTPIALDENRLRIFIACTDTNTVGRIGFVDVDSRDPSRVLQIAERPVLDIGEPGMFDDNGVNITSIVRHNDDLYLYYFGYQLGVHVRYFLFGGLAISRDGGASFTRVKRVPIIERTDREPLLRSAPFVLRQNGKWRMWYVGGERHIEVDGTTRPTYELRYIESDDGISWPVSSLPAVGLAGQDEYGLGRPYVTQHSDGFRLWYSIRTRNLGYRIGYAESPNGVVWERRDDAEGLEPSAQGWDADMMCYAAEVKTQHGDYLFYNGNGYGQTGFGFAERE